MKNHSCFQPIIVLVLALLSFACTSSQHRAVLDCAETVILRAALGAEAVCAGDGLQQGGLAGAVFPGEKGDRPAEEQLVQAAERTDAVQPGGGIHVRPADRQAPEKEIAHAAPRLRNSRVHSVSDLTAFLKCAGERCGKRRIHNFL